MKYIFANDMRSSFDVYDIGWSYWSYNEAFTIFKPEYARKYFTKFPSFEKIMAAVDYRMLEECLGVTENSEENEKWK